MAGIRKTPQPGGKFQGWFQQHDGKRKFFTGTHDRKETLAIARRLEDEHRQILLGYRPAPDSSDKARSRKFWEAAEEYLAWGKAQGGTHGQPWDDEHAEKRESLLRCWMGRLNLQNLGDMDGILPRVEEVIRELLDAGRARLTVMHRVAALRAFCAWSEQRGYLPGDPLKGLVKFDRQPKSPRRALTSVEIQKLLSVAPPDRRLTYIAALATGLRADELRHVRGHHLDVKGQGLVLAREWTKNRNGGFQPLPSWLAEQLAEVSAKQSADAPLFHVGLHPARDLDKDLKQARISKWVPGGKIDFHALRSTYGTMLDQAGASAKEIEVLMRHSSNLSLSMSTYVKVDEGRLRILVEKIGRVVNPGPERAISVHRLAVGAESRGPSPLASRDLHPRPENNGGSTWESNPPTPL